MPPAYKLHPEFGYFCPSPKLRRKTGLALAFILFGSIAGLSSLVVQMAGDESITNGKSVIDTIPIDAGATLSTSMVSPASSAVSEPDRRNDFASLPSSARAAPVDALAAVATEPATTASAQAAPVDALAAVATEPATTASAQATPVDAMTAAAAATTTAATKPSKRSVSASKKPKKTARTQKRRDRDWYYAYGWRHQRAHYASWRRYSYGFWRFGW